MFFKQRKIFLGSTIANPAESTALAADTFEMEGQIRDRFPWHVNSQITLKIKEVQCQFPN